MSTWILQGNPKKFEVDQYLQGQSNIRWTVNPPRNIEPGDRIFIWRADGGKKGTGGIVAIGEAESHPIPGRDDAPDLWNERIDYATNDETLRVRVALKERRLTPEGGMILRTELQAHPTLHDLPILGFAAQIVYKVKPRHEDAIMELWAGRG